MQGVNAVKPPRPVTHDLLVNLLQATNGKIQHIIVSGVRTHLTAHLKNATTRCFSLVQALVMEGVIPILDRYATNHLFAC